MLKNECKELGMENSPYMPGPRCIKPLTIQLLIILQCVLSVWIQSFWCYSHFGAFHFFSHEEPNLTHLFSKNLSESVLCIDYGTDDRNRYRYFIFQWRTHNLGAAEYWLALLRTTANKWNIADGRYYGTWDELCPNVNLMYDNILW